MARNKFGTPKPTTGTGTDSQAAYEERPRRGVYGGQSFVMGSADGEYGHVDGFRYGLENTGHRHKASDAGKAARRGRHVG